MKRLLYIFLTLALCACEVIPEADRLIPVPLPAGNEHRHVLLEYTGFRCVNCPAAAETAHNLQALYGDQLIIVALHPASNPFTQGLYDYTCPEADSIYRFMGGTATTSFPAGNVDVAQWEDTWFADPVEWPAWIQHVMRDTVAPYLSVTAEADTLTRQIYVNAFFAPDPDTRLALWLVEDSVPGVQAMPDGTVNDHYFHRHVLRAAVTGQTVLSIPAQCNPARCSVVAILEDINNKQIRQAYETTLDFSPHP